MIRVNYAEGGTFAREGGTDGRTSGRWERGKKMGGLAWFQWGKEEQIVPSVF